MISVSDARNRSTRSATTRSFSLFNIGITSLKRIAPAFRAGTSRGDPSDPPSSASAGLTPLGAAGCLWRRAFLDWLRRDGGLLFVHLLDDPARLLRVDVDSWAHGRRQRDRAD